MIMFVNVKHFLVKKFFEIKKVNFTLLYYKKYQYSIDLNKIVHLFD